MDKEKQELWTTVADGLGGQKEIRVLMSSGIVGQVAMTCEVINIKDAYLDDRFNQDIDKQTG